MRHGEREGAMKGESQLLKEGWSGGFGDEAWGAVS